MKRCPICKQPLAPGTYLCQHCGADLSDPDVFAMAPGDSTEMPQSSLGDAGQLADRRFLGFTLDGLRSGSGLRKLALIGGIFLVFAFFIPLSDDFREWLWLSKALDRGPTFALLLPLIAGLAGIAMALVPRLDDWIRAVVLVGFGLVGVFFCLPPLGESAGTQANALPVLSIGLLVAGAALAGRLYFPRTVEVRFAVIAGAVLAVIGLVIPISETYKALPAEMHYYINHEFRELSLASAHYKGIGHDVMVRFLSMYALLPFVLLPAAAAVAWPTPGGVWDKTGTIIRPLAWLAVLYIPLGYALQCFNAAGWDEFAGIDAPTLRGRWDDFTSALMLGRARLALVSAFLVLWIQLGAVVIYAHFCKPPAPTDERIDAKPVQDE